MSPQAERAACFELAAPLFAALGDRTRLRIIVFLLRSGPQSAARLTAETDITRQAVTKHLTVLAGAGLVSAAWEGRERRWSVEHSRIEDLRAWIDRLSAEWDRALANLKSFVERS